MIDIHYYTTELACSCPDRLYRRRECKHMAALRDAAELLKAQAVYNAQVKALVNE